MPARFVMRHSIQLATAALLPVLTLTALAQDGDRRLFSPEDVHRIAEVGDIAVSPDGEWIAYMVTTTNVEKDEKASDLYLVNQDASDRIRLTHTEDTSESHPRFSPDGRYLAFIASRGDGASEDDDDPKGKSQVWSLNRAGGEARRLTEMPGGGSRS